MNFDELIGGGDLSPEEERKLRRVHDLILQAGPPPDLPPALEHPTDPVEEAEVIQFPLLPPRRWAVAAIAAAALALAAFGGGYAFGHSKSKPAAFQTQRSVGMHGTSNALAVVRIGKSDSVGNWPMEFEVTGLPQQHARGAYYELWLTRNGKPTLPCGSFRVHGKTTRVRLTVPYSLGHYDGWVVTAQPAHVHTPGRVVLTT